MNLCSIKIYSQRIISFLYSLSCSIRSDFGSTQKKSSKEENIFKFSFFLNDLPRPSIGIGNDFGTSNKLIEKVQNQKMISYKIMMHWNSLKEIEYEMERQVLKA